MDTSLLATKFNIPSLRPGLVTRPRLLEQLQHFYNYKLILISAPAGFGKTTLLSEWILHGNVGYPYGWVTLNAEDKDPLRFWTYVITALKKIIPSIGETSLSLIQSTPQISIVNLLTVLLNEINSVAEEIVLILDDYHLIDLPQINQEVTFLLEHIPPNMHLIISTRIDPSLPLARYRGKGTIMELRENDLRFTAGETESLLSEIVSTPISAQDIKALNMKAEGWVAGLKMAGISMRDKKDLSTFIADFTGSQRYIMDYLI